jgi:hypothetical protein
MPETQTGSGVSGSRPYGPAWADRYNFALVQRRHIIGIESQPGGDAEIEGFLVPGAAFPDQSWSGRGWKSIIGR